MKPGIKTVLIFILLVIAGKQSFACECIDPFKTIDSLPQLQEYEFIALVNIKDAYDVKLPLINNYEMGEFTISIVELFKGKPVEKILDFPKHSSCNIGISAGEEWIVFVKRIKGRLAVVACDRNKRYKEKDGLRDWKYGDGFYELRQLRKLYKHEVKQYLNEKRQEYYANGKPEIEEVYLNGRLNGERKIWYPSGVLFCRQKYINDTLDGKSEWFYQSGQMYDEHFYRRGKSYNISRIYYDSTINKIWKALEIEDFYKTEDSMNFVYHCVQAQYEQIYDSYGNIIISREYDRIGKITKEEITDPDRKFTTVIFYNKKGFAEEISYKLNDLNFGHYEYYDENGFPEKEWEYNDKGEIIKQK